MATMAFFYYNIWAAQMTWVWAQFFNDAVVLRRLTWNKQATKLTIEWP